MSNNEIKKLYLSLISNPDAQWRREVRYDWVLYHCEIDNLSIESIPNYKLIFTYTDTTTGKIESSQVISFSDIGISKFRIRFPFFGICAQIQRRIDNANSIYYSVKLTDEDDKIKSLLRDQKLNEILNDK